LGGEDLDGTSPCSSTSQTITWTGIDITGKINLEFQGLFGLNNSTSWDGGDELRIEYQIDGGGFTTGIVFEADASDPFLGLSEDVDFDGFGDGPSLTPILSSYSFLIPGTGTTLELRFTAFATAAGEEFAIDNFRLNENVTLPVKLSNFKATLKDKSTLLKWETLTEENNDYFQVEHSLDGRTFRLLDRIQGNGNSHRAITYSFLHEYPNVGVNYYRLKQVDFDGAFEYSEIKAVDLRNGNTESVIYPNPFNQSVTIQFPSSDYNYSNGKVRTIEIYDIYGKLVVSTEVPMDEPKITVDLSTLHSGTYFIHTLDGKLLSTSIQRIVKI